MFMCESICISMCMFEAYNVGRDCIQKRENHVCKSILEEIQESKAYFDNYTFRT